MIFAEVRYEEHNVAVLKGQASLNATYIAGIFNIIGEKFFNEYNDGYIVSVKIPPSLQMQNTSLQKSFLYTDSVSDLEMNNGLYAFFYSNNAMANENYHNFTLLKEVYYYETGNSDIFPIKTETINNVNVSFYKIIAYIQTANLSRVNMTSYGSAFSYGNILFIYYGINQSICYNSTAYAIRSLTDI
ncbi:MAG: hypothetical protein ACP5RP_01720 [Candidatus Micrarchaeia archaeon]